MIYIPAGTFLLGTDSGAQFEAPERTIYLDDFWIDKCHITNAQFADFVRKTSYRVEGEWRPSDLSWATHPAVLVTWNDAMAYASWRGATLPTEFQWEKAARGVDGRRYPWGARWDPYACHCWHAGARASAPVGCHPRDVSPFGVADVAGNVSDWCLNDFAPIGYSAIDARNPTWPLKADRRATRGGNWFVDEPQGYRLYVRGCHNPQFGSEFIGFRCCRTSS